MPNMYRTSPQSLSNDIESDHSLDTMRRPYVRPALWVDRHPMPQHWDLASGDVDPDISEQDGYVLSANGEGSMSGVFVPCDPLSAVRGARPGRLRVKPFTLHRRRIWGATVSPTLTTSPGFRLRDHLPPTPSTPNTDFKNLYHSLRQRDVIPAPRVAPSEVPPAPSLILPPISPALSRTPSSSLRQRPVLHVQTSSPVGTSPPPPTPALPSPYPSKSQFRSSGRLPNRPTLPLWTAAEHYPRAVVV
ncbi:hypothetical protein F5148DRAFT_1197029 [Russula earlei]|uniref:Uncharacterized protein n=1 Tax=Russula earlei TaxID=71964 RepID=A0ACC0UBC4_9AGAM|nr:hypothetical protein F5148DRAFT_1197029 [Russula earlei]